MPQQLSGAFSLTIDRSRTETLSFQFSFGGEPAPELEITNIMTDTGVRERYATLQPAEIILLRQFLLSDVINGILADYQS